MKRLDVQVPANLQNADQGFSTNETDRQLYNAHFATYKYPSKQHFTKRNIRQSFSFTRKNEYLQQCFTSPNPHPNSSTDVQTCHCAQNIPADYLDAHNTARLQVSVPNITWDAALANYAQSYSNSRTSDCNLVHSNGSYGENLAKGSGSFTGADAVNLWVAEKPYYLYCPNTSQSGQQCLHYTQVVWKDSVRAGCGRAQCDNGWWFVTCSYDPPGNWVGERPY
uniref:SCP domain-containing protein n=1 Tax=Kalanchoe fedtschenkoi TaxID=63787 RepID=A0A7N0SV72_KALFE